MYRALLLGGGIMSVMLVCFVVIAAPSVAEPAWTVVDNEQTSTIVGGACEYWKSGSCKGDSDKCVTTTGLVESTNTTDNYGYFIQPVIQCANSQTFPGCGSVVSIQGCNSST